MKVTMPENWKSAFTMERVEIARRVIKHERENDDETPNGWAEYAVREALKDSGDFLREIITAKAEIAENCRIYDAYFEGSAYMDVWISAVARTANGFIEVHAYLSDIWQSGAVPFKEHMYIQYFKETKLA